MFRFAVQFRLLFLCVGVYVVVGDESKSDRITAELMESTGKTWTDFSETILREAWNANNNQTSISVLDLLDWFRYVGGEEQYNLIRLLELMDKDYNGQLSQDEFLEMYSSPMTSPEASIELMHKVYDSDGDGNVSMWELLTYTLTVDGINRNILDKYKETRDFINQLDTNGDKAVSSYEFANYLLAGLYYGLSKSAEKM